MLKIKLYELEKHRNETTFRPLLFLKKHFQESNIEFVTTGHADLAFVSQASFIDKNVSIEKSIEFGLNFTKKIKEPFFLIDGQDSSSLMGSYEILTRSNALGLLKTSLLKNKNLYKMPWINGRIFWGRGEYACESIEQYINNITLTGFNWLNTYGYNLSINSFHKNRKYDVCALFGLSKENYEFTIRVDEFYNSPRKKIFEILSKINAKVITTEKTGKLNKTEYTNILYDSKICISPYGYGEIAIRDIEAILAGCIIIKPNMSGLETYPNIYEDKKTFIECKEDYSDLSEKIEYVLINYDKIYEEMYNFIFLKLNDVFNPQIVINHYKDILNNL